MSRIREAFTHGKAFIPFITCGDPSVELTEKIVYAMEEAGADLIELGIPFSDPTAEGPVIQDANLRALSGGITTDAVFEMVRRIRRNTSIPMAFMTYANVVFSYGTERFIRTASEIGMDGLILSDVPFEEKEEFDSVCRTLFIHGIFHLSLFRAFRMPCVSGFRSDFLEPSEKERTAAVPAGPDRCSDPASEYLRT